MPLVLSTDTNPGSAEFVAFGTAAATTPLFLTGSGLVPVDVNLVIVTLPGGIVVPAPVVTLPADYPVGVPLALVRTDANTAGLTAVPASGTIDGGASVTILPTSVAGANGPSGYVFMHDGTNWWTIASTGIVA